MFIPRDITDSIKSGAQQIPVVAIIGPRQSGKSTLAREIFKNHIYLDMQDAELFAFATQDPKGFLNTYKNEYGLIIDEAQYVPGLFSQIKVEADRDPRVGYYVLSGSQNFLLHEKISESLAGRVYFYTLLPLSIEELKRVNLLQDQVENQFFKGFYPRVYQPAMVAQDYYASYISTYVERDIRSIRNIDNILTFKKLMQLCALRIGTTLTFSDLASDCGVSVQTVKNWLSLLHTSFILFFLPSYHENLGKRVTKSPKLYFYDVGLACSLMETSVETVIKQRVLYGALFENMIIVDLIKNLNAQNVKHNLTFFRDTNKNEVDLIIESQGKIIPIEIKASQTVQNSFFKTVEWFNQELSNDQQPIIIYGGDQLQMRSKAKVITWKNVNQVISIIRE